MESGKVNFSKSTKSSRKRTKPSTTAQEQLKNKRPRVTRSKQKMADVHHMKENSATSEAMMMVTQDVRVPRGVQKHHTQLACKENVVSEHCEGLGTSLHTSVGPLRPRQQQQLPACSGVQPLHLEGRGNTELDAAVTPKNTVPLEFRGHGPVPNPFQSTGHTAPVRSRQPQQSRLKFNRQMMSLDSAVVGSPLPQLKWVRSAELWWTMRSKDISKAAPEAEMRLHHPEILSTMRIILLDWMMEVCEEYKLHRETYYLAMNMFDRFMDTRTNVRKEQLQLLGVTCLFIASKIEEIYPPKAHDFAYVTDGACSVADLLDTELIICKVLNWKLSHDIVTVNTWVNTYLQLSSHHLRPAGVKAKEFDYPAYSSVEFPKVMKLLDLCSFDIASRKFGSSVLAASAIYLQSERSRANLAIITGFELKDIEVCVNWLYPFAVVLSQKPFITKNSFPGVAPHDTHNIQTHDVSISMMDDSVELRRSQEATPSQYALLQDCSVMMTPPRNERRCLAPINTVC